LAILHADAISSMCSRFNWGFYPLKKPLIAEHASTANRLEPRFVLRILHNPTRSAMLSLLHQASPTRIPQFVPECAVCGGVMRLVAVEPHGRFPIIDVRSFICECGQQFTETVPRYWLGILDGETTSGSELVRELDPAQLASRRYNHRRGRHARAQLTQYPDGPSRC
jgi:hypothetical protein